MSWDHLDCYGYIPLSEVEFCTALLDAEKALDKVSTFFDIGCGIGQKLQLATELGWESSGIEIRSRYADVSIKKGLSCILGDARSFSDYDQFDCILLNYPILDHSDEIEFESWVIAHMKIGAILILFGLTNMQDKENWESVGDHCWRKLA